MNTITNNFMDDDFASEFLDNESSELDFIHDKNLPILGLDDILLTCPEGVSEDSGAALPVSYGKSELDINAALTSAQPSNSTVEDLRRPRRKRTIHPGKYGCFHQRARQLYEKIAQLDPVIKSLSLLIMGTTETDSEDGGEEAELAGGKTCPVCGVQFAPNFRTYNFKRHTISCRAKAKKKKPEFSCSVCQKVFNKNAHLKRHILHHIKMKNHLCTQCGRQFGQLEHLKRHIESHKNATEEKLKCPDCDCEYTCSSALKRHRDNAHNLLTCFKCAECGEQFNTAGKFRSHHEWHLDLRKYECKTCGRCFKQKLDLKRHQQTHTDSPSFQCAVCHATFNQKIQVNRHLARLHACPPTAGVIKSVKCTECAMTFDDHHLPAKSIGQTYQKHLKVVHQVLGAKICTYCFAWEKSAAGLDSHVDRCHFKKL